MEIPERKASEIHRITSSKTGCRAYCVIVKDGSVLNLHIRIKVCNLVDKCMWPYYLITSMEVFWEINSSAKSKMAATGHSYWSYLGKSLAAFHYIGVNYKVFEGWQSIG